MQTRNHEKMQKDFSCTVASLIIIVLVTVSSLAVLVSGKGSSLALNGYDVWYQGKWYLLFTSLIALYSMRDLIFFVGSVLYLVVKLPEFEKKYTTLFTLYHFFKINLLVQLYLVFQYATSQITMKINHPVSSGIYCYALYLYAHECFESPMEWKKFLCSTFLIPNCLRGIAMVWAFSVFAPSQHGLNAIFLFWVGRLALIFWCFVIGWIAKKFSWVKAHELLSRKYWASGSQFECLLDKIEQFLRISKITGFVTIAVIKQIKNRAQVPKSTVELVEQIMHSEEDRVDVGSSEVFDKQTHQSSQN